MWAEIRLFSKCLTILLVTSIFAYPDKLYSYLTNFCYSILRICLQHNFVHWYVLKEMISFSEFEISDYLFSMQLTLSNAFYFSR
jgi:hypothetical protein